MIQLDNNCTEDKKGSVRLRNYRRAYRSLAQEIGVRLTQPRLFLISCDIGGNTDIR